MTQPVSKEEFQDAYEVSLWFINFQNLILFMYLPVTVSLFLSYDIIKKAILRQMRNYIKSRAKNVSVITIVFRAEYWASVFSLSLLLSLFPC